MVQSTSRRGILEPEAARAHFRLTRVAPAEDLAHLVERHWSVEWDLAEPFTQEVVSHPSFNMVFEDPPMIFGVFTGRFRKELVGAGHVLATKFRPGGFHAFHPVPAHTLTNGALPVAAVFGEVQPRTFDDIEAALRAHGFQDDPRIDEIVGLHALALQDPSITRVDDLCRH